MDRPIPRSLRKRVTASIGATFIIYGADRLLQIVFLAILGRLLTPSDFGVLASVLVFVSFVQIFAELGVGAALVQAPRVDDAMIKVSNGIVMAMAILLFVLSEAAAPAIAAWFRNPVLLEPFRVACSLLLIQGFMVVPQALMLRQLRSRDLNLIDLASGVTGTLLVAVPLALLGFSYWSLVLGTLGQFAVRSLLLNFTISFPRRPVFKAREARNLLSKSTGFSLAIVFNRIAQQADNLMVGRYLSPHMLGLYSRAYLLMETPARIYQTAVDRVFFPALAQVQDDAKRLRGAYIHGMSLTATGGIPLAAFMVIAAPELVGVLLGPQWHGAIVPFQILSFVTYFRLAYKVSGTVLRSTGHSFRFAFFQLAYAVLIVGACLLAYRYGLAAIAVGVSSAIVLNWALMTISASRITGVDIGQLCRAHFPGVAGGLLVTLVAAVLAEAGRNETWPLLLTLLATFAGSGLAWLIAALSVPAIFLGRDGPILVGWVRDISARGLARLRGH